MPIQRLAEKKYLRVLGKWEHGDESNPPTGNMYVLLLQKLAEATVMNMRREFEQPGTTKNKQKITSISLDVNPETVRKKYVFWKNVSKGMAQTHLQVVCTCYCHRSQLKQQV